MANNLLTPLEQQFIVNLLISLVSGLIIGLERELKHKPAGVTTQALVVGAAMLFSFISRQFVSEPTRIAAQIVSGIGFLGAGIILKDTKSHVTNVTTAASVWYSAAVGMAIGFGYYFIAILATVYVVIISRIPRFDKDK